MTANRRLTKTLRDDIRHAVLCKTFKRRDQRLQKREHAIALALRDLTLGAHKEAFLSLPRELQGNAWGNIYAQLPGDSERHRAFSLPGSGTPCPVHCCEKHLLLGSAKGRRIAERAHKWVQDRDKLKADRAALAGQLNAVLNSTTTVKALLDKWPEAAEFVPERDRPMSLPAVQPAELNAAIKQLAKEPRP